MFRPDIVVITYHEVVFHISMSILFLWLIYCNTHISTKCWACVLSRAARLFDLYGERLAWNDRERDERLHTAVVVYAIDVWKASRPVDWLDLDQLFPPCQRHVYGERYDVWPSNTKHVSPSVIWVEKHRGTVWLIESEHEFMMRLTS